MAQEPENTFKKALEKFRDSLTEEQKNQISATSIEHVKLEIKGIQDRFGPEKKLRNLKRVSKFLEAMKQLEQVVQVFLNVHEVVAFIWGPIKLVLLVAGTRIDTLERLLDTYVEIGEVIPGLQQYEQLFQNCPAVREVLERYWFDILHFHRKALDVFARPAWETVIKSAWKTFETNFKPIIDSLKRHRNLLLDEKLTAAIAEIQNFRESSMSKFNEQSEQVNSMQRDLWQRLDSKFQDLSHQIYEIQKISLRNESEEYQKARQQQICHISERLGAPDYALDHSRSSGQRFSNTGDWITNHRDFLSWLDSRDLSRSILYLHGKPGAGKTTLVSRIIDYLKPKTSASMTRLLYFYFKHYDETKRSVCGMLRALLVQLIHQDDTLIERIYEKCSSTSTSELRMPTILKELVMESLKSQSHCLIILDGLDECEDNQHAGHEGPKAIIEWFQNTVISESRSEGGCIRLLLAAQRDGVIDKPLSQCPNIKLDQQDAHFADIRDYTNSRASEIRKRFFLTHEDEATIIAKVISASKGMFLYAKVVLNNLMDQGSEAELEDELKAENFPNGLSAAYERVVIRILDRPGRAKKDAAAKILGWITCAARPLRWREIQSRFCIDFKEGQFNLKCRRVDSCKILCGSLVEAEPCTLAPESSSEEFISLVHDTAGKYLINRGRICLWEEHAKMAIFSSRYLSSSPFKQDLRNNVIRDSALSGYYGFQDYAAAFWDHHVESLLNLATNASVQLFEDVFKSVICFFKEHKTTQQTGSTTLEAQPGLAVQALRMALLEWRETLQKDFEERTSDIRNVVESIDLQELDDRRKSVFLEFNGTPRYKCPKLRCQWFALGFSDRVIRDAHINEHERPFKCSFQGCYARTTGFTSQNDLDIHLRRVHSDKACSQLFPLPTIKKTNIFAACRDGDLEAVKAFISRGVNIQEPSRLEGQLTPLAWAAREGHIPVCQHLVQHNAEVYLPPVGTNVTGATTALGEAIKRRDHDLFRIMVEAAGVHARLAFMGRGNQPDIGYYVRLAVNHGALQILKELLSWYNRSSDAAADTILHGACEWHKNEDATRLLLSRLNSNDISQRTSYGKTPLHEAVWLGKASIVRLLLKAGADVNVQDYRGNNPIFQSISSGSMDTFLILLNYLDDFDTRGECGRTLLHMAVERNWTGVLPLLPLIVERGVNIDATDTFGKTALHLAADKYSMEAVQLLITLGANIHAIDANGQTVLHLAAKRGNIEAIKLFCELGGNINATDRMKQTALHLAAAEANTEAIQLLFELGANIDATDRFKQTALHIAAQRRFSKTIQLLIDLGASISVADEDGKTALDRASKGNRAKILKKLEAKRCHITKTPTEVTEGYAGT